ncbi:MAG: efflux RND transporter permease subunit, partial [Chloroflexi bacterium]|nr:efflux RND transporter permease subunit [Chloroflexota bacterium]
MTLLLSALVVLLGGYLAYRLEQTPAPSTEHPSIAIVTSYPGAGPRAVAAQVTAPLETAIGGVNGLYALRSASQEGRAVVVAQFEFDTDLAKTTATLSTKFAGLTFPEGVGERRLLRSDLEPQPVIYLNLTGMRLAELERIAKNQLVPRLKALDGVASVELLGRERQEIRVVLDPALMTALNVPYQQVSGFLQLNNVSLPSGSLGQDGHRLPIRTIHQLTSVREVENLVVGLATFRTAESLPILLKAVGSVQLVPAPDSTVSRTDGVTSLGILVTKARDSDQVRVARAIRKEVDKTRRELGAEAKLVTVLDLSNHVSGAVLGLAWDLLLGLAWALVVVWFFFGIRTVSIVAFSALVSLGASLVLLFLVGLTLNAITVAALVVATSRIIVNLLVAAEHSLHRGDGSTLTSSTDSRETALTVVGSTVATIAVFLPLAFVSGIVGEVFHSFAVAMTLALLTSAVVALVVVQTLARPSRGPATWDSPFIHESGLDRVYATALAWSLRHRIVILALAALVSAGGLALVPFTPVALLPQQGEQVLQVELFMPP